MNVKHLLGITLACLPFFFACQAKEQPAQPEKSAKVQTVKPRHLTKAEFLAKVANFEKTPDRWEFLGARPCIVDVYATCADPAASWPPYSRR